MSPAMPAVLPQSAPSASASSAASSTRAARAARDDRSHRTADHGFEHALRHAQAGAGQTEPPSPDAADKPVADSKDDADLAVDGTGSDEQTAAAAQTAPSTVSVQIEADQQASGAAAGVIAAVPTLPAGAEATDPFLRDRPGPVVGALAGSTVADGTVAGTAVAGSTVGGSADVPAVDPRQGDQTGDQASTGGSTSAKSVAVQGNGLPVGALTATDSPTPTLDAAQATSVTVNPAPHDAAADVAQQAMPLTVPTGAAATVAPASSVAPQANPVVLPHLAAQVSAQVSARALAAANEATRTGLHTITVQLRPAELGAIQVVATMGATGLSLNLHAASDVTREVLRSALADLRAELAAGGLSEGSSVEVSDQAPYQAPQQDRQTAPESQRDARGSATSADPAGRRPVGERGAVPDGPSPRLLSGLRRRVDLTL